MDKGSAAESCPTRCEHRWVRTFLFSMRRDAPLSGLHVITKLVLVLAVSVSLMNMISTERPDPLGAGLLLALGFVLIWLSGVSRWLFRSYLVVIYPMLLSLFLGWIIFYPDPGTRVLFSHQLYSGSIRVGISVAMVLFLAIVIGYYLHTKHLFWGFVVGAVAAFLVSKTPFNLFWSLGAFPFYRPLNVLVSDWTVLVSGTKVLGYGAMVLMTLLITLTTRDIEVIGAMRKIRRIPYVIPLFCSLTLRSLNLALIDYSTIHQAHVARGINVQKKSVLARLKDMAQISVPLIANMVRRSTEIADALSARGYTMNCKPAIYREVKPMKAIDWAISLGAVGLSSAILGGGINLTEAIMPRFLGMGL